MQLQCLPSVLVCFGDGGGESTQQIYTHCQCNQYTTIMHCAQRNVIRT